MAGCADNFLDGTRIRGILDIADRSFADFQPGRALSKTKALVYFLWHSSRKKAIRRGSLFTMWAPAGTRQSCGFHRHRSAQSVPSRFFRYWPSVDLLTSAIFRHPPGSAHQSGFSETFPLGGLKRSGFACRPPWQTTIRRSTGQNARALLLSSHPAAKRGETVKYRKVFS